jgi:hypothetical protein
LLDLQHQTSIHSATAEGQPHFQLPPAAKPTTSDETQTTPAADEADAPQTPHWAQTDDEEELDTSVREYIERLLQQVSDPSEKLVPAAAEVSAAPPPQNGGPADQEPSVESRPLPAEQNVSEPAVRDHIEEASAASLEPPVLAPLSLPPESELKLDAMREVANLSATAAIRDFEKNQAARKTFDRLPLLLIGLVCGLMLLYSAFLSGKWGMFVGAGAAFVGAALTAWQLLALAPRWLSASQPVERDGRAGQQT